MNVDGETMDGTKVDGHKIDGVQVDGHKVPAYHVPPMDHRRRLTTGARVQQARESLGWSQATLAINAGVSENTVSSIERGKHRTQPEKLRSVLDALGLAAPIGDVAWLNMEEVPKDVQFFLAVVAQRLTTMDSHHRSRLLARVYPMLLVDDPEHPLEP